MSSTQALAAQIAKLNKRIEELELKLLKAATTLNAYKNGTAFKVIVLPKNEVVIDATASSQMAADTLKDLE